MSARWYIVQTKPLTEDHIRQRWAQIGFDVFLPRIKKMIRGIVKPIERTIPLFPSYIFGRFDLADPTLYRKVRFTRGVKRVLGVGDHPIPVDNRIVQIIRERANADGILEQHVTYQKGDQVRVRQGFLADLIGVLEKPVSPAGRVRVLLELYHKTIHAEFSCSEVEKV